MTSQKTVCVGGYGQRGGLSFFCEALYFTFVKFSCDSRNVKFVKSFYQKYETKRLSKRA